MLKLFNFIKTKWIVITISTLAAITVLSIWPLEKLPLVPGTDKAHHIIAYAILMFPTALNKPKTWKLIGLFFIAYSGVIELLQPYVNRHGEWSDMAANTTGIICGLLLAEIVIYFFPANFKRSR